MYRITRTLIFILVTAGIIVTLILWPKKEKMIAPIEPPPVDVVVQVITPLPEMANMLNLQGVVEPNRVVTVSAEEAGRIEKLCIEEGSLCSKDQLLITLNTDLLKADLDRAQAQAKFDTKEYQRISELQKGGAATTKQLEDTLAKMEISKADLASAAVKLKHASITAPIGGIVNEIPVEVGEYVVPGTTVAQIVETNTVKVTGYVSERDIHFFKVGDEATIFSQISSNPIRYSATITYISTLADEQTRSTKVEITVPNPEGVLRSGDIVRLLLVRQVLKDVIMIPLEAVIPVENGESMYEVYVVENDLATPRRITLGLLKEKDAQILGGLNPGDRLVIKGQRLLGPGQRVNVHN